jgi:hypothetical protein
MTTEVSAELDRLLAQFGDAIDAVLERHGIAAQVAITAEVTQLSSERDTEPLLVAPGGMH